MEVRHEVNFPEEVDMVLEKPTLKRRILDMVRQFNKRVYNPLILRVVRHIRMYAVVDHVGRRSGKPYRTPVAIGVLPDAFVLPLPYGDHVDWFRNIQAVSRFTIEWLGQHYAVERPEPIGAADALPTFTPSMRRGLQRFKVERYIRVRRCT
jgi:deazaflavin-dependent oxidoreductase (nitroreductase family)